MNEEKRLIILPETQLETGRMRLGRHVEHDAESRTFKLSHADLPEEPRNQYWHRTVGAFNQGDLGSCTTNALLGCLMTEPFNRPEFNFRQYECMELYKLATQLDDIEGSYPPDDTGSSGLAAMKAARRMGYIRAYYHAFSMKAAFNALQHGPVITGVNWYEGFDKPNGNNALIEIAGDVRGGHEFEICGVDFDRQLLACWQSWGNDWGNHGMFTMSFETWEELLSERGDCTAPRL